MSYLTRGARKEDLIELAEELGFVVEPNARIPSIKDAILGASNYDEETTKDLLKTIIAVRLEKEKIAEENRRIAADKEKRELLEIELERLKLESSRSENRMDRAQTRTLEQTVNIVKILTVNVPTKPEGWSYFFTSLEKAFSSENVSDEFKPKILMCLLGDKIADLLVNIRDEDYNNYECLKKLVLKEFEPCAQACLEAFRKAKRNNEETFSQFVTRLSAMWAYYCKLRNVSDFESLNNLIISDKVFQSLDPETSTHIGITQRESWLKPKELGQQCDIFYSSKGKSFGVTQTKEKNEQSTTKNHEFSVVNRRNSAPHYRSYNGTHANDSEVICFICNAKGHKSFQCPYKKPPKEEKYPNSVPRKDVNAVKFETPQKIYKTVQLLQNTVNALIDPGSDVTLMDFDQFQRLGKPQLNPTDLVLSGIIDEEIKPLGQFPAEIFLDSFSVSTKIYVLQNCSYPFIIGMDILSQLNIQICQGKLIILPLPESPSQIASINILTAKRICISPKKENFDKENESETEVKNKNSSAIFHRVPRSNGEKNFVSNPETLKKESDSFFRHLPSPASSASTVELEDSLANVQADLLDKSNKLMEAEKKIQEMEEKLKLKEREDLRIKMTEAQLEKLMTGC